MVASLRSTPATLLAWGANRTGQVTGRPGPDELLPVPVPGLPPVVAVTGNGTSALALDADGQVWGWGLGMHGLPGRRAATAEGCSLEGGPVTEPELAVYPPARIDGLAGIVEVTMHADNAWVRDRAGRVWSWGSPHHQQRPSDDGPQPVEGLPPVVGLATDPQAATVFARDAEGGLWSWGGGWEGELGRGKRRADLAPGRVELPAPVRAIAAGSGQCLALLADGSVHGWGHAESGIGFVPPTARTLRVMTPVRVEGIDAVGHLWLGGGVVAIYRTAAGDTFTAGIGTDLLYPADPVPRGLVRRPDLDRFDRFVLGGQFGFAVDAAGAVWSFGKAQGGALGDGKPDLDDVRGLARVPLDLEPAFCAFHTAYGFARA